jgi:hypothetical protein
MQNLVVTIFSEIKRETREPIRQMWQVGLNEVREIVELMVKAGGMRPDWKFQR